MPEYKAPITIHKSLDTVVNNVCNSYMKQMEQHLMEAVSKYCISVDKDELIKALNYDREQYAIGYKEGRAKAYEDIILQIEAELESSNKYIRDYDDSVAERAFNKGIAGILEIVKEMAGED